MQEQKEVEVDLRDYINVVLKRKGTILSLFFISVIITGILTYLSPRIYRIAMIIEPTSFSPTAGAGIIYLDSVKNIKEAIENGAFDLKIVEALNLDARTKLKFRVSQPKGSQILRVSTEQEQERIEEGKRILNQLFNQLSNTYYGARLQRESISRKVSAISIDIKNTNSQIKLQEESLPILRQRENELAKGIREAKARNNKQWSGKKDVLLFNYLNQLMISYVDKLKEQLFNLKLQKQEAETSINDLQCSIEKLQIDMEKLRSEEEEIHHMRFIREPTVSLSPIKPKKRQNIAVAGVLGLMLGIFTAFFQEYWGKTGSTSSQ